MMLMGLATNGLCWMTLHLLGQGWLFCPASILVCGTIADPGMVISSPQCRHLSTPGTEAIDVNLGSLHRLRIQGLTFSHL